MRPEEDIARVVRSVCEQSGHWPYTADADVYIGFRPAGEELRSAANRTVDTQIEYDIVICGRRGAATAMEEMRYRLYDALREAGWRLTQTPGPETYVAAHELFLWPLSAGKRFAMDKDGLPEDPAVIRARGEKT